MQGKLQVRTRNRDAFDCTFKGCSSSSSSGGGGTRDQGAAAAAASEAELRALFDSIDVDDSGAQGWGVGTTTATKWWRAWTQPQPRTWWDHMEPLRCRAAQAQSMSRSCSTRCRSWASPSRQQRCWSSWSLWTRMAAVRSRAALRTRSMHAQHPARVQRSALRMRMRILTKEAVRHRRVRASWRCVAPRAQASWSSRSLSSS